MNQENKPQENFLEPASKFWRDLIDLKTGVDKLAVIEEIKAKKSMNGANAWMLMCSIMIASIGLNLNSPAVIIGAMLISPLMSPILGMGLAVGINDKLLLKKGLRHFGAATLIAILTSTIYFYISPFQELTSEISARTTPTFLDIIIGFFGGIAGIISIARKDISTTLPGVAIATALMPPLCVCGYGIASGQWGIASSSFYLFFLNTLFVSLATYAIIRYLDFPYKQFVSNHEKRRNLMYIAGFVIITMIPSIFIFNRLYDEFHTESQINQFITEYISSDEDLYYIDHKYIQTDTINQLQLITLADSISTTDLKIFQIGLESKNITNTEIIIRSPFDIASEENNEGQLSETDKLASQLEIARKEISHQAKSYELLQQKYNSRYQDTLNFKLLCNEIKVLYPDVNEVNLAYSQSYDYQSYNDRKPFVILSWNKNVSNSSKKSQSEKITEWLKLREGNSTIEVINK